MIANRVYWKAFSDIRKLHKREWYIYIKFSTIRDRLKWRKGRHGLSPLVIFGDIHKEVWHWLPVVDASNGLGQQRWDINSANLMALHLLYLMRNRIGDHHLVKIAILNLLSSITCQKTVSGKQVDLQGNKRILSRPDSPWLLSRFHTRHHFS